MYKSKFIQLYQQLSKAEVRRLKKWINSPIHNKHPKVQKLYEFLFSRHSISAITLKRERIFKRLFPNATYNYTQLSHIVNYAYEVLQDFIGYNESICYNFEQQQNKIRAYRKHKLPQLAEQCIQQTANQLEAQTLKNGTFYKHCYELEAERFELYGTQNRTAENNLPQLFSHLSDFFAIATLKYACTAASHRSLRTADYAIPMLEIVLEQAKISANPTLNLYYYSYLTATYPDNPVYFPKLKYYFFNHHQKVSPTEAKSLFTIAINYCIRQLNTGAEIYVREVFELYKQGIESEILLEEGFLSRFSYKNAITAAVRLQEYGWVSSFVKKKTKLLEPIYQNNYAHYATAKLHFAKGNYEESMSLLRQVDYDDLFLNIDAKVMLLKMYYEQSEDEPLEALLNSFQTFLQRKKVMSYHKSNYQNIVRLTRKLLYLPTHDKKLVQELKTTIENTNPLTERVWLLGQLKKSTAKG